MTKTVVQNFDTTTFLNKSIEYTKMCQQLHFESLPLTNMCMEILLSHLNIWRGVLLHFNKIVL